MLCCHTVNSKAYRCKSENLPFLSIQGDNTIKINNFGAINLLGDSGHLDKKMMPWTIFSDILSI